MSEMRELTAAVNEVAILFQKKKKVREQCETTILHTSNPVKLPIHYPSERIR